MAKEYWTRKIKIFRKIKIKIIITRHTSSSSGGGGGGGDGGGGGGGCDGGLKCNTHQLGLG